MPRWHGPFPPTPPRSRYTNPKVWKEHRVKQKEWEKEYDEYWHSKKWYIRLYHWLKGKRKKERRK